MLPRDNNNAPVQVFRPDNILDVTGSTDLSNYMAFRGSVDMVYKTTASGTTEGTIIAGMVTAPPEDGIVDFGLNNYTIEVMKK